MQSGSSFTTAKLILCQARHLAVRHAKQSHLDGVRGHQQAARQSKIIWGMHS